MKRPDPLEDHFLRPRNAGILESPDVSVQSENPVCGDRMRLFLRLRGDGRILEARFQVYGCPAAIAAGSILTELLVGKSREELASLGEREIAAALGGLDAGGAHAAVLAADSVEKARALFPPPRTPFPGGARPGAEAGRSAPRKAPPR